MKRVLVTGASGFIGRHTLDPLLRSGYEVHGVGRRPTSVPNVHWHEGDLLDSSWVGRLLEEVRPTHLLHLAWYAEHGLFWNSEENFRWVSATHHLVERFGRAGGIRIVAAGSCAEYGAPSEDCDEIWTPSRPLTIYGKCKTAAQLLFEAYCIHAGISGAWGRIFHLYGPGEHPDRLVAAICSGLLSKQPVLCTHGRQLRDFLHVYDVAEAFTSLLSSDVTGCVNIGSGIPVTVGELAQHLACEAGSPELLLLGARAAPADEPKRLIPVVKRLQEEVGWRPSFNLESGLSQTFGWKKTLQSKP